jgi:phospholipid/cholesterol/gamma-HCH transport system substrate-binding protein
MSDGVRGRRKPVSRMTLGVIGVVLVSLFVWFVFTKRIPFLHDYRLKADFTSSNQLVEGFSPVRIAGVTVGKVTSISDGPGDTTQVEMELKDAALPVHEDATVRIRPRLFLEGGFYVALDPGSPSAPELDDQSVLPVEQTDTPVQLHQILATFDQDMLGDLQSTIKELDTGLANGGAEGLGRAVVAFGPVLRDTAILTEAARGPHPHDVSEGIGATSKITTALASRESDLRGLLTSLNTTTTALASRDAQIAESIVQLDGLIREAPAALDSLAATKPSLIRFIAAVRPALRMAPPILDDAAATFAQLRGITAPDELPALLDEVEPTVRGLPVLEDRLNVLFPLVTPVMDCLREHAVPVLKSEVPDGALSSGLPVWKELPQAGVGVVGFAQNFDGNGYWSRFLNGSGEQSLSVGSVPGLGQLVGTLNEPIAGARPSYLGPGVVPPHRPDAPCADQAPVDLAQRAGGGTAEPTGTTRAFTAQEQAQARETFEKQREKAQAR